MGLKKWLGLDVSASQHNIKADDEVEEPLVFEQQQQQRQRRQQRAETHRRHTTWEAQQNQSHTPTYAPTRRSAPLQSRPAAYEQQERRFSTASTDRYVDARYDNDTMSSMVTAVQSPPPPALLDSDSEDSDVSVGADDDDDDFAANMPSSTPTGQSRNTTAASPMGSLASTPQRNSVKESFRFSWMNVLGQSTNSEMGQSAMAQVAEEEEAAEAAVRSSNRPDGQTPRNTAHNPDVALRPQDDEMGVVMQGWLEKCGQQFKTWNWRFFVLRNDGVLSYYADETLKKLKGSMDIGYGSKADVSVQANAMDKKFVFLISTPQRNLMISAPSERMMTKWIARLHAAGAVPTEPLDPLRKTVKFYVRDTECNHEWKRYDDPTSYIHMEGCLLKRGHVNKNWKNRSFRIEKGELRYYTENQSELKGSMPLKDTIVSPGMAQCPDGRKYYFVLTSKDGKFEMHLNAHNENSMHLWIEALQEAQTALGRMAGNKGTVAGLSLVVKRAEEIPLGKIGVLFKRPEDIDIEMQKRTEALIVASSPRNRGVSVGSQLISVEGRSILRETYAEARKILRASSFPLQLEFLLAPYKRGVLIKKSRSGFENWKRRVVIVTNGEIHYYKQVSSFSNGKRAPAELKHRKSFSLYGCYLNVVHFPGRDLCIVVARSPSDKLVLQTRTDEERMEWASVIYCSIRMVSQGITSGHIENLQLEQSRLPPQPDRINSGQMAAAAAEDNSLYPIAILVDELKHEDVQLRLNSIRQIRIIAEALGPERTQSELLPFMNDSLDDEDEVLLVMAEELGDFVDVVGGPPHAYLLLKPLESLATVDEASVRDMAVRSICKVVEAMEPDHVAEHFVPVLRRLVTRDWFTSRIASCSLFQVGYARLSAEIQAEMRGMFGQLCRDDTPMVRKAASAALGGFASVMDGPSASAEMLPLFLALATDRQDSVRIHTIDNAVALARLVPAEILPTQVLPTVFETARDGSWRVRWSVANRFPEICEALNTETINSTFCDSVVSLLEDNEAEVRTAATSKILGVARLLQPQRIVEKVVPCFQRLARDMSDHVRSALAAVVMKVAPFLGRDLTIEHLLPLFLLLLNDQNSEVRLNVISNLEEGNKVIGIELLSQSLLPAIVHLAEDRQWRIRLAIIEYIPLLAAQLGRDYFEEQLSELCMSWLVDNVFSIREAATINLKNLTEHFGVDWARTSIVPRILAMHSNANYLHRLTSLHAVKVLCEAMTPETIQTLLIPLVVELAQDPVPNIRFNVAKTLEVLGPKVDAEACASTVTPCLTALLQDGDTDVVFFAQRALATLG
ncbi:Serine/threonine-protein phosphatase 2A regulatory subunit A alpha isoform [Phytophthora rubi]|uniref:Serine/threonine-protein phosphatase 2A regulatory subunit A alpha isoform n=2 Tax=Phytophthora rubi TaxID=129364 RepID=A0A6A3P0G4_9STRA|nr:Serine/threonine-protein phosphatase 2A regulatory subunit A alpha isoform [Phytophthora rubi]